MKLSTKTLGKFVSLELEQEQVWDLSGLCGDWADWGTVSAAWLSRVWSIQLRLLLWGSSCQALLTGRHWEKVGDWWGEDEQRTGTKTSPQSGYLYPATASQVSQLCRQFRGREGRRTKYFYRNYFYLFISKLTRRLRHNWKTINWWFTINSHLVSKLHRWKHSLWYKNAVNISSTGTNIAF